MTDKYQHAWPIEDPSLTDTELREIALPDLDEAINNLGFFRAGGARFERKDGWLIATANVRRRVNYTAVAEDVEWLLDGGEHPERIARRLGVELDTLRNWLIKAGRPDLRERLNHALRTYSLGAAA